MTAAGSCARGAVETTRYFLRRRHVGAGAVGDFGGHADGLAQGGVGVDGLADIDGVAAHLDGQATSPIMSPAEGPTMAPPMMRWLSASKISLVKP